MRGRRGLWLALKLSAKPELSRSKRALTLRAFLDSCGPPLGDTMKSALGPQPRQLPTLLPPHQAHTHARDSDEPRARTPEEPLGLRDRAEGRPRRPEAAWWRHGTPPPPCGSSCPSLPTKEEGPPPLSAHQAPFLGVPHMLWIQERGVWPLERGPLRY